MPWGEQPQAHRPPRHPPAPAPQGKAIDAAAVALKVLRQARQCVGPQPLIAEAQLTASP